MGNLASSEESALPGYVHEHFTRQQIVGFFQWRAMHLLTQQELSVVTAKLNVTAATDSSAVITYSDLAYLLQLLNDKRADIAAQHADFVYVVRLLYDSFKVWGNLPLLKGALGDAPESQLTLKALVLAALVHLGRMKRLWGAEDPVKLVFLSLAVAVEARKRSHEKPDEKSAGDEDYVAEVLQRRPSHPEDTTLEDASKRIRWSTFRPLQQYDDLDVDAMLVLAYDLVQVVTLCLIVNSVPRQTHVKMQQQLQRSIADDWAEFQTAAVLLVRYLNIDVAENTLKNVSISYQQFCSGHALGVHEVISLTLTKLFKYGLLLPLVADPTETSEHSDAPSKAEPFVPSRLMHGATISVLTVFLRALHANVDVSLHNLVPLYNGSQSGFSVRSLELKIFKWQAPTIFLVSGKRLRSKTIATNKRYQQFDAEYPRFFRSTEDPNRKWQLDHDRITIAVFVNQPWRNSNKKNFGDDKTAIMVLLPRCDIYRTRADAVLQGQLIYFNNLGMGLGFGNDQPVNKNNVRKYLPGSISLTIEANLEFGVFRHIASAGANMVQHFTRSEQDGVCNDDYEDRFMITDLEVWGVGSTKELEEQRKQWEWEEKQAQARQSVNIRSLGEDRAFLEMAGLVGNHAGGGSM